MSSSRLRARPRRGRPVLSASVVVCLLLLLAGGARGQELAPRTSSLSWVRLDRADECVGTQDLARDVEERLGRSVFVSAAQADVSVEGHIEPKSSGPGFHAVITLRDAKGTLLGTRELSRDEKSCAEMRETIALVIAVMIDPDATLGPVEARPPLPPPAPPPPPAPVVIIKKEPVIVRVPAVPAPQPPQWRLDAGASLVGSLGLLPHAGIGVGAGGLLEPPGFIPLEVFGAVWLDNAVNAGRGQATFSFVFVGGGLCPLRYRRARVHAYACGAGLLGLLKSHGSGFDVPRPDQQRLFVGGALEGRLSLRLFGPIAARAGLSLVVPLARDAFVYQQQNGARTELFRMAPVAGLVDFGFGVVLP